MSVEFFKASDFEETAVNVSSYKWMKSAADAANAKLERECMNVYGFEVTDTSINHWLYTNKTKPRDTHSALILNIKKINKCNHRPDQVKEVRPYQHDAYSFMCECGVYVLPNSFVNKDC